MTRYEIVPATVAHAHALAPLMREHDRIECGAFGYQPLAALLTSIRNATEAWTGLVDGEPVCMFGVSQLVMMDDEGQPWLLATDKMVRHARVFLRLNRGVIPVWRRRYGRLFGAVSAANAVSIRWLRWLGFAIGDTAFPVGPSAVPHLSFVLE